MLVRSIFFVLLTAVLPSTGCLDTGVPSSALPPSPKPQKGVVHVSENVVAPQPAVVYNEKPVANVVETSSTLSSVGSDDNVTGPDLEGDLKKSIGAINEKLEKISLGIEELKVKYFVFVEYTAKFSLTPSEAIEESNKIMKFAIELLEKLSQYREELEKIERRIDASNLPHETKDSLNTKKSAILKKINEGTLWIDEIFKSLNKRTWPYIEAFGDYMLKN